jgi:hypothetical protein
MVNESTNLKASSHWSIILSSSSKIASIKTHIYGMKNVDQNYNSENPMLGKI